MLRVASLALCALALAPLAAAAQGDADALLGEALLLYEPEHFLACEAVGGVVLNEVCGVGTECDEDVRVADFVEVYNPGPAPVDLRCFVIATPTSDPFLPRGELAAGEVRAWGEGALGFRIRKADDEVVLFKLGAPSGTPGLALMESVTVEQTRAHSFRSPDGGAWRHLDVAEAESERLGSFDASNPSPRREGEPNDAPEPGADAAE